MKELTTDFLAQKNIAVAGVSRNEKRAANFIYKKLRGLAYNVAAVNPNATTVEGDTCYPDLTSIPVKPGAVVIVTKPSITESIVKECAVLGISKVWIHNGIDSKAASVSPAAIEFCKKNGITVIPFGCPMMYCRNADLGHRFMCWLHKLNGKIPKQL